MDVSVNSNRQFADTQLSKFLPPNQEVVYMCIGCDKVIADSLGPRVGSLLQQNMKTPIFVYGSANSNINAVNLIKAHKMVRLLHPNKKIVVIDAAVGEKTQIGTVSFCNHPLKPGSATNKNLPSIGDYSIMGIVATSGLSDFYSASYDKQLLVEKMAQTICSAIINSGRAVAQ